MIEEPDKFITDLLTKFNKDIKGTKQKSTSRSIILTLQATDRVKLLKDVQTYLKSKKIDFKFNYKVSSVGGLDIPVSSKTTSIKNIRLLFKPISGGFNETTLNSTITELVPAILFTSGKTFTDPNKCLKFLLEDTYNKDVYVNTRDMKAGYDFIHNFENSSKFNEKMNNAFGVLKYLKNLNSQKPIKNVKWCYRAKPNEVHSKHKGDLFIQFIGDDRVTLGVSLKAGSSKSIEPKLNTYVIPLLKNLGYPNLVQVLHDKIYKDVLKPIGLPKNLNLDSVIEYRKDNDENIPYNKILKITRKFIADTLSKDLNKTKKFIKEYILGVQKDVPLQTVKVFGDNYKILTDEDELESFLPLVKNISNKLESAKQNFSIILSSKSKKLIMNMSVRTNKTKPKNKLAQSLNLAVKFNSISK